MADLPHRRWFEFFLQYLPNKPTWIGELFCGPAAMAHEAARRGYRAIALDREKSFLVRGNSLCADARALPLADSVLTGAIATNSSLNYLNDTRDLALHLCEVARVLEARGVYVFDTCPHERALALDGYTHNALESTVKISHTYDSRQKKLMSRVALKNNQITEVHPQRIFSDTELRTAAKIAGFRILEREPNYALPTTQIVAPVTTWVLARNGGDSTPRARAK